VALTWNQSWNRHSEHPNIRRALFVEEPIIHEVLDHTSSQEHQKEYWPFSKKEDYNKDSNKSEGTGATMHQVNSVTARAVPEK